MKRHQIEIVPNTDRRVLGLTGQTSPWRVSTPAKQVTLRGSRIVLLVHGYNNDRRDADRAYLNLENALAFEGIQTHVLQSIWEVFWPGYIDVGASGLKNWFSFTSYPVQVGKVGQIAPVLARFLNEVAQLHPSPLEVFFVAHSLGCRLVLETLKSFTTSSNPLFKGVCLMAAAVPTFMVEQPASPLSAAAALPGKRVILYSPTDNVLRFAFPLGQTAALNGALPEAVGRFGNPSDVWCRAAGICLNTGLDHGEYFSGPLAGVRTRTSPYVARLLGHPVANALRTNQLRRRGKLRANTLRENVVV